MHRFDWKYWWVGMGCFAIGAWIGGFALPSLWIAGLFAFALWLYGPGD